MAIAAANQAVEVVVNDLQHLLDFIREHAAVRTFLYADDMTVPARQQALMALLGGRVHPLLVQFSILLAVAGDISLLDPIAGFCKTAAASTGTISGEIHSAVALSEEQLAAIESEVAAQLGQPSVRLRPRIMSNILGGVLVHVGDYVIDGTLDTQLENVRQQLANAI